MGKTNPSGLCVTRCNQSFNVTRRYFAKRGVEISLSEYLTKYPHKDKVPTQKDKQPPQKRKKVSPTELKPRFSKEELAEMETSLSRAAQSCENLKHCACPHLCREGRWCLFQRALAEIR